MNKLKILKRLNEEKVRTSQVLTKHLMDRFTHVGIEVHGVDKINIWVFLAEILHSSYHTDEAVTEVLATMTSDKDKLLAICKTSYVVTGCHEYLVLLLCKGSIGSEFVNDHVKGIDNGIACYIDIAMRLLFLQILL